jgi:DNA primase
MSTENAELRAKIDEAKRLLPMPSLLRRLGHDEKHIGKTALCPFHSDEHPSFSVFEGKDGWQHKCFVGCSSGDEIAFLVKALNVSRREAINRYLEMAGFPAQRPKSREYPELPKPLGSPKSLSLLVYPVSLSLLCPTDKAQRRSLETWRRATLAQSATPRGHDVSSCCVT